MNAIWHLIRKDHRVVGRWLALWAVLQILVTLLAYFHWRGGSAPGLVTVLFFAALIVGTVLVVRVVHEEPLIRGVDFWRTRPLRPKHLLLGKGFTIGLHFVLLPSLICLIFLLATGYRSHLGIAGVEWFWKLASWLIPVIAIAVFSDSFPRFLGIAFSLGIGFGILLAVHLWIQREVGWYGPRGPWASLPSGKVVFGMAVVLFGSFLTLRQYLVGGLRGAIKWLVLGAIVIQGLWWLPLSGTQFANEAALPPSNTALDELTGDFDLRIGPLPRHDQTYTERNGLEFLRVQREPSLVVASRHHDLHVSIDESASRLESVQGEIVSSNPKWVWKTPVVPQDCLASIGAIQPVHRFHMGNSELLEVPRSVVRQWQDTPGTLHLEALAVLREGELVARVPLRVGARFQRGPEAIQIHSIEHGIDHGRPHVRIDCQMLSPNRLWTRPWPRVGAHGFEIRWLVHRRLHFVLHFGGWDGRSGTTGPIHPLMNSRRYFRRFDVSDGATLAPSLWEEEFRPEDWDLVFVRKRITASKRLPVTVPDFQLWRELPQNSEGLLANLEAVSLPQNASDAEVEDYLWDLCRAWKSGAWSVLGETFKAKLSVLEPKHLPVLLQVHERMGDHYWSGAKDYQLETILAMVTEEHQELILDHLDSTPSLLSVVKAQGWEELAIPRMTEIARGMSRVPSAWIKFFIQMGVQDSEAIMGMSDYTQGFDDDYFEPLREISGFPLEELVDRVLFASINRNHYEPPEGLRSALAIGRPNALEYARLYLKGARRKKTLDHAGPLLERLAEVSSCPSTAEEASAWLELHARTATFDETSGLYQLSK